MFKRLQKHFRYQKLLLRCDCEPDSEWVAFFLSKASWLCSKILSVVANTLAFFVCTHGAPQIESCPHILYHVSNVCVLEYFLCAEDYCCISNEWPTLCAYTVCIIFWVGSASLVPFQFDIIPSLFIGLALA